MQPDRVFTDPDDSVAASEQVARRFSESLLVFGNHQSPKVPLTIVPECIDLGALTLDQLRRAGSIIALLLELRQNIVIAVPHVTSCQARQIPVLLPFLLHMAEAMNTFRAS